MYENKVVRDFEAGRLTKEALDALSTCESPCAAGGGYPFKQSGEQAAL